MFSEKKEGKNYRPAAPVATAPENEGQHLSKREPDQKGEGKVEYLSRVRGRGVGARVWE